MVERERSSKQSSELFPNKRVMDSYGIDYITADLSELTGGYGGAHCMTATIRRG